MVAYGPPGVGKTEMAAQLPGCVFLVDDKEDGINTLKASGRGVRSDVPVFPAVSKWSEVMEILDQLASSDHKHKGLVIDTIGGMERLCHEFICQREYNGDWGDKGFSSYMRGYEVSLGEWRQFLNALDRLRDEKQMSILLLAHSKIEQFKNPSGPDYERYNVDLHRKTWATTHKWADVVLFLNFEVATSKENGRTKGRGGQRRVIYTEYDAAYEAKNRMGLPPEIDMGSCGSDAWSNFTSALKSAKGTVNGNV